MLLSRTTTVARNLLFPLPGLQFISIVIGHPPMERWVYLDGIYFSVDSMLTIWSGGFEPMQTATRILLFPFVVLTITHAHPSASRILQFFGQHSKSRITIAQLANESWNLISPHPGLSSSSANAPNRAITIAQLANKSRNVSIYPPPHYCLSRFLMLISPHPGFSSSLANTANRAITIVQLANENRIESIHPPLYYCLSRLLMLIPPHPAFSSSSAKAPNRAITIVQLANENQIDSRVLRPTLQIAQSPSPSWRTKVGMILEFFGQYSKSDNHPSPSWRTKVGITIEAPAQLAALRYSYIRFISHGDIEQLRHPLSWPH
ncbi:hypothetical protein FIBSPDRAFT_891953 [Athelia psychrophila]|uniref:Uncharacterized protein n=1 Tax=Athelia psychrophila TaxID=1759441 RepID=A0A166J2Q9_9AGAM|nr:hypothetical protein FIBSPDRAFT_891953 [Fibularhizoctonia sp. CBS 109695]